MPVAKVSERELYSFRASNYPMLMMVLIDCKNVSFDVCYFNSSSSVYTIAWEKNCNVHFHDHPIHTVHQELLCKNQHMDNNCEKLLSQ